MCANPEPTFQRYTTKRQTPRCSSHTSVFWTLPEQLAILYTPRMCANPEPTFQRYITTPQTVRCSSHTSVSNFAGAALHVTPRMWANPSWTNVPRHTTNFRSENFHLTHPCFELCQNRLHACVPTLNQRSKDTPQDLRPKDLHLTHPCFELCRSSSPYYTTHVGQPIVNQRPKRHYKLQIRILSSHTSVLNFAGTAPHVTPHMWANPSWTNVPRHTTNFRSENVHLTHPCFELCWNNPEQITPRMCANPSWTNVPKTRHKTSDPKIFISHPPLLNFAGAALHVTPHMWANPSWTNVPRHTTNFRSDFFHLTHPCFELCRNSSPCYTTHVSQPILYQRPKIHHKPLMTQLSKPILIQPPKIHLSKFPCSLIGGKNVALARRHGRMKTCVRPSGQKWFSVSFSGLNYLRPTYCKNALKRCSLSWNPLASWLFEVKILKYAKRDQKLKSWGLTFLMLNLAEIWQKKQAPAPGFQPGAPNGDWNLKFGSKNSQGSDSAASLPIVKLSSTAQLRPLFVSGL